VALKPFDERLFLLKLQPINQRMHAEAGKCWARARAEVKRLGNHARLLPAFVECQLEVLRKYLEEVYGLRREVWLLDGNAVTPEFIRTMSVPHAFTVIAARKGAIQHELNLHATRTGEHQRGGHILAHQMNRLQSEVANRYEIEAIELEKQAEGTKPPKRLGVKLPPPTEPVNTSGGIWLGSPEVQKHRERETAMKYPGDFPVESRAKVEAARIRAGRRFDSDKTKAKWISDIEALFKSYVLTMFLAFAEEAWRLRLWPVDKMRENCQEFLRLLTIEAYFQKGRAAGLRDMISNWNGSILWEFQQEIEKTPQWRKFENILLKLAEGSPGQIQEEAQELVAKDSRTVEIIEVDPALVRLGLADYSLHRLARQSDEHLLRLLAEAKEQHRKLRRAVPEGRSDPDVESVETVLKQLRKALALRGALPKTFEQSEPDRNTTADKSQSAESLRTGTNQAHGSLVQHGEKTVKGTEGKSTGRRAIVDAYIQEVLRKTGKRITRKEIWTNAGYTTRTEFERWERQDPRRPNNAAHETFARILREKPHLK
jgi:hypothetical protein